MKKFLKVVSLALVISISAVMLMACDNESEKDYKSNLEASGAFDNTLATSFAQTEIASIVKEHLDTPATDGKTKKAIILAFDGTRADAMLNIVGEKSQDGNIVNYDSKYSGINYLRGLEDGGLYLAYCGGIENDKATKQAASTSPGFATILTGQWGAVNGVIDNGYSLNTTSKTILREYAEKDAESGKKVSFIACWDDHFNVVFKPEFDAMKDEPKYTVKHNTDDDQTQADILNAITTDDLIFSIYEWPDHNGHETGFTNDNYRYTKSVADSDRRAYEVITAIYERMKTVQNEDWLIIMTTDHGGKKTWHGGQSAMERTTWIACNKKITPNAAK